MGWSRWGAWVGLLTLAACFRSGGGQVAFTCEPSVIRLGDSVVAYAETPVVVSFPDAELLLGSPTFAWSGTGGDLRAVGVHPSHPAAGVLLDHGKRFGRLITAPDGISTMRAPRAVTTPGDTTHVVWGSGSASLQELPQELFEASWTRDGGWGRVRSIGYAGQAHWSPSGTSALVRTHDGLAVAIPAPGGSAGDHVLVLVISDDSVIRSPVPTPAHALYADLAAPRSTLVVAFVSRNPGVANDTGHFVMAAHSSDGGTTWSRPQRVSRTGRGMIAYPRLVTATDTLLLVWSSSTQQDGLSDSVHVAFSVDNGLSWRSRPSLHVSGGFVGLATASSRSGLHLVVGGPGGGRAFEHWVLGPRGWRLGQLPRREASSIPTMGRSSAGDVIVTWGEMLKATALDSAPAIFFARIATMGCPADVHSTAM